ncbi:MAG: hypothetical protein HQL32_17190 [Planctomycetes bacterium]|nr:hypothetical protein [Planctomycetota bacterium]
MKTAISIPDKVFTKAERYAKINGMSRSQLFTIAVQQYVETDQFNEVTDKLNEVYSDEPNGLERDLSVMQANTVFSEEW